MSEVKDNKTRKVVILRNINSPSIDQAILVLKDGFKGNCNSAVITEAEKIIDDYLYLNKYKCNPIEKKAGNKNIDLILNAGLILSGIIAIFLICKLI